MTHGLLLFLSVVLIAPAANAVAPALDSLRAQSAAGYEAMPPEPPRPYPAAARAPQLSAMALAAEAVREVRLLGLRSPSEIKMTMDRIVPGSPQAELLPALKAQYEASLKDLLALRGEFDKEFVWGSSSAAERPGSLREPLARNAPRQIALRSGREPVVSLLGRPRTGRRRWSSRPVWRASVSPASMTRTAK